MNSPTIENTDLTKSIYEAMQIPYLSERHDAIKKLIEEEILSTLERLKGKQKQYLNPSTERRILYAVPLSAIEAEKSKWS